MAITTPYAQDDDLDKYDNKVRNQGIDSYNDQLLLASNDILNLIKTSWWFDASGLSLDSFEEDRLNTAALEQLTVYKAFYSYIFPLLSKFTEGDTLVAKIEFYEKKFMEEWNVVKSLPLYDFDDDTLFEDDERRGPIRRRLVRG
jgi:hypothetical protein